MVFSGTGEVVDALDAWLDTSGEVEPWVVETSGSTGVPKRVQLPRAAVLASAAASAARVGGTGRWLLMLPAAYVAGINVIVRSLLAGHRPVLAEEHGDLTSMPGFDYVSLVPTQLLRMLDSPADVAVLARAEAVLLGGGPSDPALLARAAEAGVRVVTTYGSAETCGGCVYDARPLDGVRLDLEPGTGRLLVSGPTLFSGYAGDPALTAEVLVDGWFRTSDAARIDEDGRLTVLGRIDDMVVSGGVNVPAPAVAARLRAHPDVAGAEVLGVPDPEWGTRLVAFVVGPLDLVAARDWVAAEHPRAWAPRQVVAVDEIPLLANGKPDRLALRGLA